MLTILFRSSWGSVSAGLNLAAALSDALVTLGGDSITDAVFWTQAELYEYMDEAAKRLARTTGVFIERDASQSIAAGTATYAVPARHLSSIHVSAGSRALQAAAIAELEALDDAWPATAATVADPTPVKFTHPTTEQVTLYPNPALGTGTPMAVVFHRYPAEVTASAAVLAAPECLREYFAWSLIASARGKESKGAMPEVAEWFSGLVELMEQVIEQYWGEAQ